MRGSTPLLRCLVINISYFCGCAPLFHSDVASELTLSEVSFSLFLTILSSFTNAYLYIFFVDFIFQVLGSLYRGKASK